MLLLFQQFAAVDVAAAVVADGPTAAAVVAAAVAIGADCLSAYLVDCLVVVGCCWRWCCCYCSWC